MQAIAAAVVGGIAITGGRGRLWGVLAGVLLLVAMITAIALTLRQRKDSKAINPSQQIRVRAKDRLEVVKVTATQKPAPEVPAEPAAEEKKP